MTKPTDPALWATDTDYSSGPKIGTPTKVAFDLGEAEQGHYPGNKTPGQKQNSWQNNVGQWTEFVDGLFDTDGKLLELHGPLEIEGPLTIDAGIEGDLSVNGDLDVSGNITAVDFYPSTTLAIIIGAQEIAGTGLSTFAGTSWTLLTGSAGSELYIPIQVPVGCVIGAYSAKLQKTSASGTITTRLLKTNMTTGAVTSPTAGVSNSANNPGFITLAEFTGGAVTATECWCIEVKGGGVTGDALFGAEVLYTKPAP